MAFNPKALQIETGAGATGVSTGLDKTFRRGTYITEDNQAAVETGGYFNAGAARLAKNTVLTIICVAAGTPVLLQYIVTGNSAGVVTIALQKTTAAA